jgi:hypothetical protein
MSTEQTESTTQQPQAQPATAEWGAPPPPAAPRSKWTVKRTAIAVAVAVGIAAAGGAAIYAASGSVTNDQSGPGGGMAGGPGGRMVAGPFAGANGTQHGEFQTGEVTEISDTSITVKSEDDYTETYTIDDDTQVADGIEKGDEVTVIATTEGDTTTAATVMEMGAMQQGGPGGNGGTGGNGGPPNGGNNGTPPTTN